MLTRSEYKLAGRELAQRYFTCKHCGAHGEVAFGAHGSSGWTRDGMFVDNVRAQVERAAEADLRTDAMRTQALIRCPTCGRREAGAVRWVAIRIGFWLACGAGLVAIGGVEILMGAGGCATMAIWQGLRERGRFKRARGAVILQLEPGKLPEPEAPPPRPVVRRQLAPPPELPPARVISVPAQVVQVAPDPGAPPKFLVDLDRS